MKLTVVFPVHNQFALAESVLDVAKQNLSGDNDVEFLVINNGSAGAFLPNLAPVDKGNFSLVGVRLEKNIGVYPIFWEALKHASGDVLAFLHSDVFVAEAGWDTRVLEAFSARPGLGLLGFIGSDEIDGAGGRGLGTSSNFLGQTYRHSPDEIQGGGGVLEWTGSAAEVHGRRITDYMNAAVVDGCVMIFRRAVLEQISQRENFPPHHFYDKLLSCEVREKGYEVGVLGVGFDHISGQTVNQEPTYHDMAAEWAEAHGIPKHEGGWDATIYTESERLWLSEYRDQKHLIPVKV